MPRPSYLGGCLALLAVLVVVFLVACDPRTDELGANGDGIAHPTRTWSGEDVLYVGPGEQYLTIGDAVAAAGEGSIVLVHAGVYEEQIEINQAVRLEAFGDGAAIIDGQCARQNAIWIPSGSEIVLSGLQLRNTTGAAIKIGDGPEDLPQPSHLLIEGMLIGDFNCEEQDIQALAGIAVWYPACCVEVRNNVIRYRSGDDLHGKGDGIWFKSNSGRPSGGRHVIAGNVIVGGWDGIGGENEDDPHGTFDRDSVVEGNHIRDCWDDGIQVEGGNANVTVRDNYVTRCGTGIAFAPTLAGPLHVERNVIRELRVGLYENQFCFKAGNSGDGVIYLSDNICETEGDGISQTNSGIAPIVSRRNCFRVTRYVWQIGDTGRMDFDDDNVWSSGSGGLLQWDDTTYPDLRAFERSSGQEANGTESPVCP